MIFFRKPVPTFRDHALEQHFMPRCVRETYRIRRLTPVPGRVRHIVRACARASSRQGGSRGLLRGAAGSQREERLDVLDARMAERGIDKEHYGWYRDLRRYGTVPHAGFGLGFERLVQYSTGMGNIRDVIPFPRYPKHAEF